MSERKDAAVSPLMMDGRYQQSAQAKYNIKLAMVALKQGLAQGSDVSVPIHKLKEHLEHYVALVKPEAFSEMNEAACVEPLFFLEHQSSPPSFVSHDKQIPSPKERALADLASAVEHWLTDERFIDQQIAQALKILLTLKLLLQASGQERAHKMDNQVPIRGDWSLAFQEELNLGRLFEVVYTDPNLSQSLNALTLLARPRLIELRDSFYHERMVKLMHQIHLLCYCPEVMPSLSETLSPSRHQLLAHFYHCLIALFDAVLEHPLLAGEERRPCPYIRTPYLPSSIKISTDSQRLAALIQEINHWPEMDVMVPNDPALPLLERFYEAYKFRFNPSVLLDMLVQSLSQEQDVFSALLQQASTQTCIDLHAFLSGKDTHYLLRCLHALKEGLPIPQIDVKSIGDNKWIAQVYEKLLTWKAQLRDALCQRHMSIELEVLDLEGDKILSPGERLTHALKWLIEESHARSSPEVQNERLEGLFSLLSSYHHSKTQQK